MPPDSDSQIIIGKWLKVSETGIEEYMKALGSPAPPNARLVIEWIETKTGHWIQTMQINELTLGQVFKLGKPFEHESFDGSTVTSTITVEGNRMTEVEVHNGKEMHVERVFNGDKMSTKFSLAGSDVVASNEFVRVSKCEFHVQERKSPMK